MERDPESARLLLEQIQVELQAQGLGTGDERERPAVGGEESGYQQAPRSFLGEPLDLMRLIARMGMKYSWMSNEAIGRMHFVTFYGYVREARLGEEEEERALKEQQQHPSYGSTPGWNGGRVEEGSLEQIGLLYPPAPAYVGDVVQYGGR